MASSLVGREVCCALGLGAVSEKWSRMYGQFPPYPTPRTERVGLELGGSGEDHAPWVAAMTDYPRPSISIGWGLGNI